MAVKKTKYKRLTNAEKALNKKVRKNLIEDGFLPPPKKRLNRNKFALEVMEYYKSEECNIYRDLHYFAEALVYMLPLFINGKIIGAVTPERIGVLKVIKIVKEIKAFWLKKENEGVDSVTISEFYDEVVKPIIDL